MRWIQVLGCLLLVWILGVSGCGAGASVGVVEQDHFVHELVHPQGSAASWGKAAGDIDGDGFPDLIVGGHGIFQAPIWKRALRRIGVDLIGKPQGDLVWYRNPDWQRNVISTEFAVRTDLEVGDLNGDGKMDLALLTDRGIVLMHSPDWLPLIISRRIYHDIELADLDLDGNLDMVARDQSLFGHNAGNSVHVFWRRPKGEWVEDVAAVSHGEGLAVRDMNRDGAPDIVINDVWLRNPGDGSAVQGWSQEQYAVDWQWPDVFVDVADFNADGWPDIVLSPAESKGQTYQIAWFESPGDQPLPWRKHVVLDGVEAILHFVAARDVNRDGRMDVLTAEMNQGADPDEVFVVINLGNDQWQKVVLGTSGSHSMRALDIDNDFDVDLFGANWQFEDPDAVYPVSLWKNQHAERYDRWTRHIIDAQRPGQAVFVFAEDLNGDGRKDVATGAYWYRQPDVTSGRWERHAFGAGANNAALVEDFDGDGDADVLASQWVGYGHQPSLLDRVLNKLGIREREYPQAQGGFVWAENQGGGRFVIRNNVAHADGDFLQGAAYLDGDPAQVFLSWHSSGKGIQALTVPQAPATTEWGWTQVSPDSQDEQLQVVDLDGDGRQDVLLGTKWLRQTSAGAWELETLANIAGNPDRNAVADVNGDGRLDVVIGFQAVSEKGKLAWYEHPETPGSEWREHVISAEVVGPMSVGVGDIDSDGDIDVVVGEHNLKNPDQARLIWFEQLAGNVWKPRQVSVGDEHHDGALLADIDGDGDLDVVSIGWSHGKVLWYENPGPADPG